jgi:signal transduction histidine kinase
MKTPSRIFIAVLLLLAFLASLAWVGVRQLADILREFDHVAQVDLVLMEGATNLNDIQLKKEIIFAKLASTAEELAFGQVNAAREQYLKDYLKELGEQFDHYTQLSNDQMQRVEKVSGVPADLSDSFEQMRGQAQEYDSTIQAIFKAVENGGFQLSLEDLERTDDRQRVVTLSVQNILSKVWDLVRDSVNKTQRWHDQAKIIFWFSLLLTATLGLLLFAFKTNLEEISRQKKDLEKLNQELDRFVHTVSHDIAGPLTTIVGYAAHLDGQYSQLLDERGRDCIKGVRKGATRLNILIKDMLELTKMSRVKNPYSRVSMKEVVDAAIANCDFMIRQSGAVVEIERTLPEIVCDRIKITAVFFNLINNALKFTKQDVKPVIKINWNETREGYEFYVKDNGLGIDVKHHQEIFGIFKRLHPADQISGSGVGLAIVQAALEDQGGHVRVESNLGQGAKFIFTIPKNLIPAKLLYK